MTIRGRLMLVAGLVTLPMQAFTLSGNEWLRMPEFDRALFLQGFREGVWSAWSLMKFAGDEKRAEQLLRIWPENQTVFEVAEEVTQAYLLLGDLSIQVFAMLIMRKEILNAYGKEGEAAPERRPGPGQDAQPVDRGGFSRPTDV